MYYYIANSEILKNTKFHIFASEDIDHVIISRQLHCVYKLSFRSKNGEVCESDYIVKRTLHGGLNI